tara:strand:- start:35 stop:301 length:267 start_codon:yes stop_codon:yes gene_type:complete
MKTKPVAVQSFHLTLNKIEVIKMVSTMNIINEIVNGNKTVILRDPVPKGAVGISLVFGDDERYNGLLDIEKNKDLLILLAKAMEDEEE